MTAVCGPYDTEVCPKADKDIYGVWSRAVAPIRPGLIKGWPKTLFYLGFWRVNSTPWRMKWYSAYTCWYVTRYLACAKGLVRSFVIPHMTVQNFIGSIGCLLSSGLKRRQTAAVISTNRRMCDKKIRMIKKQKSYCAYQPVKNGCVKEEEQQSVQCSLCVWKCKRRKINDKKKEARALYYGQYTPARSELVPPEHRCNDDCEPEDLL